MSQKCITRSQQNISSNLNSSFFDDCTNLKKIWETLESLEKWKHELYGKNIIFQSVLYKRSKKSPQNFKKNIYKIYTDYMTYEKANIFKKNRKLFLKKIGINDKRQVYDF